MPVVACLLLRAAARVGGLECRTGLVAAPAVSSTEPDAMLRSLATILSVAKIIY